jgi:hypothetical protein
MTFEITAQPAKNAKPTTPMISILIGWARRCAFDARRARNRLRPSHPIIKNMQTP